MPSETDTRVYAYLVGVGVTHSIAPLMHNYIAQALGHDWKFLAKECPTVEDAVQLFRRSDFAGGVVTMPYKRTIMDHLDGLDEYAIRLGACNNVYRTADGKLRGTNTDWRGIKGCLLGASEAGRGKPAVLIGAGGAARAAIFTLYDQLECRQIYLVNRDRDEVKGLLEEAKRVYGDGLDIIYVDRIEKVQGLASPYYIVGTVPDAEPSTPDEVEVHQIIKSFLSTPQEKGVLLDMCFKPRKTRILQAGKFAIASMSLGRAWVHSLPEKLAQASKAGFKGVEIFYEDLEYLAKEKGPVNDSTLLAAAEETRAICDHCGLKVIGMQPFLFYEGLTDRAQHREKIERLKLWFAIVKVLGTDIIQIPSNFQTEGISGDLDLIVADMVEVADLGLKEEPAVRFAYENLAWGTFISTWENLWEVVRRVDRPNFGCCLDTFNIAGRVWADPASASGKTPNADAELTASIQNLVQTVDVNKLFYVQVVDAERMQSPLIEGHPFYVEGQPARMSWSRNARLFLYEQERGGYLPVVQVAEAFLKGLDFEGWVSMELFSRSMADPDSTVPGTHAQRGIKAWNRLAEELDL
ncbi:xylose isomerase-like protein [Aspergillus pseudotamarii]|uniref:Xylose isomerase-like protein n=1 Tax=Aspergillus pseudotamarii TaxID=132259 RepID=A0A5N6SIV9_ASPPS|nr:xylose isomerase-like protein [Aspergillus pseudotamarii]KAE8133680.1 xylose isomerase-like protein [Aspergillus pseudotamarii]